MQLPVEAASLALTCIYVSAWLIRCWAAARDGGPAGLGGFRRGAPVVLSLMAENLLTCWGCLVVLSVYQDASLSRMVGALLLPKLHRFVAGFISPKAQGITYAVRACL